MALKKIILVLLIGAGCLHPCFSQMDTKKSKKLLKQADKAFEREDFLRAYRLYAQSLKLDSVNHETIYKSGLCLFNISNSDTSALQYFIRAGEKIPEAHFYAGRIYHLRNQCEKALQEFFYYKANNTGLVISNMEVESWIGKCEASMKAEAEKENYRVRNLGPVVNTKYPEYVPLISPLTGDLIFTSRRATSGQTVVDAYGMYYEDIYTSHKSNGQWSVPMPLSHQINTATHDACVSFSPDGKELIIYRTDEEQTGGDLYATRPNHDEWSIPTKLGPEINSEYLEASACFSAFGNVILFSSNRPGGYGGKDLYRVVRFLNGQYSLPLNLGPDINTALDEDAPFLDKYDNTLYFSSKGHHAMGEYDIFKAAFDEQANTWQKVENLGQPINSTHDDIYFVKDYATALAYFTSRREGGYGDADLYEVNFDDADKVIVYCKLVLEPLIQEDLEGLQISLFNEKSGKLEGLYIPNKNYMTIVLLAVKDQAYTLKAEAKGVRYIRETISFNGTNKELTIELKRKE